MPTAPKWTPEEIDIILDGDRRAIDRLILHGLNDLIGVLVPHMEQEERFQALQGPADRVRVRVEWVETQIERQRVRNAMMLKVVLASGVAAFMAFLAFAGWTLLDGIIAVFKSRGNLH